MGTGRLRRRRARTGVGAFFALPLAAVGIAACAVASSPVRSSSPTPEPAGRAPTAAKSLAKQTDARGEAVDFVGKDVESLPGDVDLVGKEVDSPPNGLESSPKGVDFVGKGLESSPKGVDFVGKGLDSPPKGVDFVGKGVDDKGKEGAPPPGPRLTSVGYVTWVYGRPIVDARRFLGYIRYGTSVALRSTETVRGPGCSGGFYPVAPRGYVCRDATTTLAPTPAFLAFADATSARTGPLAYRYAISNGAPMYNRLPTAAEQKRREARFGPAGRFQPLPRTLAAHEELAATDPIAPVDPMPAFLENGGLAAEGRVGLERQTIPLGAMLSFTRAFASGGRTWLLSTDQTVVPADRVRAFRPSTFHGVRLGAGVDLPIAWIRGRARPRFHRAESGTLEPTGDTWAIRSLVRLSGASIAEGTTRYLETQERDAAGKPIYVAVADATVIDRPDKPLIALRPGRKTIHIRLTQGTLVAYEGLTPVYATLMSPGAGGVPIPGQDPVRASTTPLGTFTVTFKDRAATMSPEKGDNRSFWIADVPYTQYFNPPFAIHASYWHERFGELASAGCVNVSPIDAQALFDWSDPPVPEEWQGATGAGAPENGPTTTVVVTR